MPGRFKTYYQLTKPGIIYGNAINVVAGFFLASRGPVPVGLFAATLGGISLVIAAGCVFNNYLDRGLDAKMARTNGRALVQGTISGSIALIYGALLGLVGVGLLAGFTNGLSVAIALAGLIIYVAIYGLAKRRWTLGTVIGSVAGAVPPVVGYTAVRGQLDLEAAILFLIIALWQMPHFYAIAIYRAKDYAAAGLPVLPVSRGVRAAKRQILGYIAAFIAATSALTSFGFTGYVYLAASLAVGLGWLTFGLVTLRRTSDIRWARQMFFASLLVILATSAILALS